MAKKQKFHITWKIAASIIALLIIIRIILPSVVLHYANKTLASMNGYFGHINDVDLAIYRGAYVIKDFYINKIDSVSQNQVS